MIKKKRTTQIVQALNSLSKTDIYSLILFTIYKMKEIPEYSVLSELCYVLDGDNLMKFLSYFGGMTITIPTKEEFELLVQALLLYQAVNIEKEDYSDAIKALSADFTEKEIKEAYDKIIDVISKYDFERD